MAKQSFSVGQVLTANQMLSLQQTAMLGGEASAKTASYTLVAADAGTAITMSNAGATTITVNTGLFAAGDTVHITNLGAGVCTITAGTATVNSSASLALAQYESGFLDFTSTSAAIFVKGAGATASAGSNWTLLNSGGTNLTGATTITVSGISGKDKIMVLVDGASSVNTNSTISVRLNADTGSNYLRYGAYYIISGSYTPDEFNTVQGSAVTSIPIGQMSYQAASVVSGYCLLSGCNSSGVKVFNAAGGSNGYGGQFRASYYTIGGLYNSSSTISSVSLFSSDGNFDAGTVFIYTSA
jgi:hypothetical protein